MNWLSSDDEDVFLGGIDDLWDMFSKTVQVVKAPTYVAENTSSSFIPAYGQESNRYNYNYTPESQEFRAILVTKKPSQDFEQNVEKVVPSTKIFLKIEQAGRDYIMDGRPNEKINFNGKSYNIISEDEPTDYLDRMFYYFEIQLIK